MPSLTVDLRINFGVLHGFMAHFDSNHLLYPLETKVNRVVKHARTTVSTDRTARFNAQRSALALECIAVVVLSFTAFKKKNENNKLKS